VKVPFNMPTKRPADTLTVRGVVVDRLKKPPAPAPTPPPLTAPAPAAAPAAPAPTPTPAPPRGPLAESRALPWDRAFFFAWCPAEERPKRRHATREGAQAEADRLHGLFPDKTFLVFEARPVDQTAEGDRP